MALARPRFKDAYHIESMDNDGIILVYEGGYAAVTGRMYSHLARMIDGQRTPEDISRALDGTVSAPEVYYGLNQLDKRGFLTEAGDETPAHVAAYWELLRLNAADAAGLTAQAKVSIAAMDERAAPYLRAALESLGMSVADSGGFEVVLVDDYLRPNLADINREKLADGEPWMLVKAAGVVPWIGPVFRPGATGCWECLAQRLRGNRIVEGFLQDRKGTDEPLVTSRGWLPSTLQLAANLAATEVAKEVAGDQWHNLDGIVLTYNTLSATAERHQLIRRPQCRACGDPTTFSEAQPVKLESRIKRFTADGGHRTMLPEQTFAIVEPHISPITGAVMSLTRGDSGNNPVVHAYVAGHNFAQSYPDMRSLRRTLRTMAGGKGASDIQAKTSAVGEAIERYSAVFRGDEPRITASYRDLGEQAIHPSDLLLFSDEQYRNRDNNLNAHTLIHYVPIPFDEEAKVEWTPVWSLTKDALRYAPTAYCWYNYAHVSGIGLQNVFCLADSNGSAAGNTLEEAILQGFMEVAERDAVAMFWYNRLRRPRVDLASFHDPYFRQLEAYFHANNRDVWAIDLTNDIGIPTFCGVTWRTDAGHSQEVVFGFGAHFDARLALMRALTECTQFLASFEHFGENDNRYAGFDPLAMQWWKTATLDNQPYMVPDPNLTVRRAADYEGTWTDDLRDDVERGVQLMAAQGLETLVLDQSRPDLPLRVAKTIVPGARHFWRRFAPGRLYDVPVKLGWLDKPLTEQELNPFPVFF